MKDLISVVLPCYNGEKFLETAIASIQHQSHQNLEIIVIDDGSTDSSSMICKEMAKDDPRIHCLKNENNEGLIFTLNKGISLAKGNYIARMDADDLSHPERIERQLNFLMEHPEIDVLGTDAEVIDQNNNRIKSASKIYYSSNTLNFSTYFAQPLIHGSILAKTEVLRKHKYSTDFLHCEDYELWLRLLSKGHKIANLNAVLYQYRINSESVSNKNVEIQNNCHNSVSYCYLKGQFEQDFTKPVVAILNNRPLANFKKSDLLFGLKQFNSLYRRFPKNKELKRFYYQHRLDICIQANKQSKKIGLKLYTFYLMARSLFNVHACRYFLEKLI